MDHGAWSVDRDAVAVGIGLALFDSDGWFVGRGGAFVVAADDVLVDVDTGFARASH